MLNPHLTHIDTERLIQLVSQYPELYDTNNKDYGDLQKRELTWRRIGKELNVRAPLCKAKWNILRGGYRRVLRNKGNSFGNRKWRFEDDMSFLKDYVLERRRHLGSNWQGAEDAEGGGSDEEEEFITIVKEEPTEVYDGIANDNIPDDEWVSTCDSAAAEAASGSGGRNYDLGVEKMKEVLAQVDGVTQFFLSLAETVKTLPPIVQAQVKAEVFRAVNNAELNHLREDKSEYAVSECKFEFHDHTYT